MKVQKLEKLNYDRFRNFVWNASLPSFSYGLNVLFGWNGSGKTTLSRFFRALEHNKPPSSFRLRLDSSSLSQGEDLGDIPTKLRVFNEEYVEGTLRGNPEIPYIFFAGKDAVDFSSEESALTEKRRVLSTVVLPARHDEIARAVATRIRDITGINSYKKELTPGSYAGYDKGDFERRIKRIHEQIEAGEIPGASQHIRSDFDDLKKQLVNAEQLARNDSHISSAARWLLDNFSSIEDVLGKEPVQLQSPRLAALTQGEHDWVKEGMKLHFDGTHKESCLFCGSRISDAEELLRHFSREVIESADSVQRFLNGVNHHVEQLGQLRAATPEQQAASHTLRGIFDSLNSSLIEKQADVTKKVACSPLDTEAVEPFTSASAANLSSVAYQVEAHCVAELFSEYIAAKNELSQAQQRKNEMQAEVSALEAQVRELKQRAKNTHEPAAALNTLFRVVFPHRKIEISDSAEGTGYVLHRDGAHCSFSSLSEGEKNFIALAYFMYSINDDKNKLAADGVVVIDDPVSSCDNQAIFQIFSIIATEVKKHPTRQYLVLTHNLDFLGHIKAGFKNGIDDDSVRLFSVCASHTGSQIESLPALLKKYRSDYYYVFSVLSGHKDYCSLEDAYLVVNLLRRWLETFLEFKFSSTDLHSALETAYAHARRETEKHNQPFAADYLEMYRFLNHGSHGFPDMQATDDSILLNAHVRIQEAFELVKILDRLHFKKLEGTVTRATAVAASVETPATA